MPIIIVMISIAIILSSRRMSFRSWTHRKAPSHTTSATRVCHTNTRISHVGVQGCTNMLHEGEQRQWDCATAPRQCSTATEDGVCYSFMCGRKTTVLLKPMIGHMAMDDEGIPKKPVVYQLPGESLKAACKRLEVSYNAAGLDHDVGHPSNSCPRWKHLTYRRRGTFESLSIIRDGRKWPTL